MTELITSKQNQRIKDAVKLRSARERAGQGRFLIDGSREIGRALDAGVEVVEAFVCDELCDRETVSDVIPRLAGQKVASVTKQVFEKLCFGERREGVVVVATAVQRGLDQLQLPPQALVAVLAGLEKPGNVGAILRTADGAGIDAVLVVDAGTDLWNPNTIRASLGTVFAPNVYTATSDACLARLQEFPWPIYAARLDAEQDYAAVDYRQGAVIVLGSEATGLTSPWLTEGIVGVRIPMQGRADSLNVSSAAAIMFYEAVRQRNT